MNLLLQGFFFLALSAAFKPSPTPASLPTTIVTGSTGRVGRLVVSRLLQTEATNVVALARSAEKVKECFTDKEMNSGRLNIVLGDLSASSPDCLAACFDRSLSLSPSKNVNVIAVHGTVRSTKFTDIFPILLFRKSNAAPSRDSTHPYRVNYDATRRIIALARSYETTGRIVRLTGLSTGLSPFNPVSMLFNLLLSQSGKFHSLSEQALLSSGVPCTILRPGGLSDGISSEEDEIGIEVSSGVPCTILRPGGLSDGISSEEDEIGIEVSVVEGSIPPPARIRRDDVASLAVSSVLQGGRGAEVISCRNAALTGDDGSVFKDGNSAIEWVRQKTDSLGRSVRRYPNAKLYDTAFLSTAYVLLFLSSKLFLSVGRSAVKLFAYLR